MDNKELDRLFRQKLEQLEGQPSTGAWQQLEQQLKHKKERKTWFYFSSIAASLLLLLGIWASLEWGSSFIPGSPVAQEQEPVQKTNSQQEVVAGTPAQTQPVQEALPLAGHEAAEAESPAPALTTANNKKAPRQAQTTRQGRATNKAAQKAAQPTAEPLELPVAEAQTELFNILAEATPAELAKPAAIIEPVIISYIADDEEPVDKAVALGEKESRELTPRKVLGFLKKVKENTSGSLAELREAKDDLLSLRLSKDDYNRAD